MERRGRPRHRPAAAAEYGRLTQRIQSAGGSSAAHRLPTVPTGPPGSFGSRAVRAGRDFIGCDFFYNDFRTHRLADEAFPDPRTRQGCLSTGTCSSSESPTRSLIPSKHYLASPTYRLPIASPEARIAASAHLPRIPPAPVGVGAHLRALAARATKSILSTFRLEFSHGGTVRRIVVTEAPSTSLTFSSRRGVSFRLLERLRQSLGSGYFRAPRGLSEASSPTNTGGRGVQYPVSARSREAVLQIVADPAAGR